MPTLPTLTKVLRVIALVAVAVAWIEIAPTLASHAADHRGTYSVARAQ